MKLFSVVSGWLGSLFSRVAALEKKAAMAAKQFFDDVAELLPHAEKSVEWVGDVVLATIQTSHLPIDEIIAQELQKIAPDVPANEIKIQAGKLAIKDRDEMLLALAYTALRYAGFSSMKLRVLKAACDVAFGIYAAKKGI